MKDIKEEVKKIKRAVLYTRVSHEEQVKYGDSLDAQEASLRRYADYKGYKVVGKTYKDEGVSAYKHWTKRKALMALLDELDETKPDILLIARLDRLTRNVEWYYQINDRLKAHNVSWECSEEDYETTTASGRTKMGFALLIAQDEAERTGERLRIVFKHKVERGEVLSGNHVWGYQKIDKHLVKDPDYEDKITDMFDDFLEHQSIMHVKDFMLEKYGEDWSRDVWRTRLKNKFYTGVYRTNEHFCEPFISMETWEKAQEILKNNAIRQTPTGKIFLFTGLMTCPRCGKKLTSSSSHLHGKDYYQYRCPSKARKICDCPHGINEVIAEKWLLDNLQSQFELAKDEIEREVKQRKPAPKKNKTALYAKLERLNHMYMDEKISQPDYDKQSDEIMKQIREQDDEVKPITKARINKVQREINALYRGYPKWDKETKRVHWRRIIKEIIMDDEVRPQKIIFNI